LHNLQLIGVIDSVAAAYCACPVGLDGLPDRLRTCQNLFDELVS